jgi:hypothetical protein
MSTATPTLIPRQPLFPLLLPRPPQPYPTPLPRRGRRVGKFSANRDLERELAELSAEEEEIDQIVWAIKNNAFL